MSLFFAENEETRKVAKISINAAAQSAKPNHSGQLSFLEELDCGAEVEAVDAVDAIVSVGVCIAGTGAVEDGTVEVDSVFKGFEVFEGFKGFSAGCQAVLLLISLIVLNRSLIILRYYVINDIFCSLNFLRC